MKDAGELPIFGALEDLHSDYGAMVRGYHIVLSDSGWKCVYDCRRLDVPRA